MRYTEPDCRVEFWEPNLNEFRDPILLVERYVFFQSKIVYFLDGTRTQEHKMKKHLYRDKLN